MSIGTKPTKTLRVRVFRDIATLRVLKASVNSGCMTRWPVGVEL